MKWRKIRNREDLNLFAKLKEEKKEKMPVEVFSKLDRGTVYLSGESIDATVTLNNVIGS